ncbi:hypothetical protein [Yoonia sp. SDW83-1]|uniref:hypothetical protein n=1 Tax=Yoonia sp. SDW83-1 TaxID=3366945 RepID=UPI00398C7DD4
MSAHPWKIVIRPDPELPDRRQGWCLAETEADALRIADHPDALAFPYPEKYMPGLTGMIGPTDPGMKGAPSKRKSDPVH